MIGNDHFDGFDIDTLRRQAEEVDARLDYTPCCDTHNAMLANVWLVLTKEERVYNRVDNIMKWLVIYIMHKDKVDRYGERSKHYEHNRKVVLTARRKLWDYMRHNAKDILEKIPEERVYKEGKDW